MSKLLITKIFRSEIIILILLYLMTIAIRLFQLGEASIYSDEIIWMVRGKELIYALAHKNFNYLLNGWWANPGMTEAIGLPLTFVSGISHVLFAGAGQYSINLFTDIFASRLPIVLIGSLIVPAIYYYCSRFYEKYLALITSMIYIFNPIAISLDRWLVHDSFLTLFTFIATASYVLNSRNRNLTIVPGIALSLAFLTKPNGIIPVLVWLFLLFRKFYSRTERKLFLANVLTFLVTVSIVWPASWKSPIAAIPEYLYRQYKLVEPGMSVYYKGASSLNPGVDYYLFQYLIRTPTIVVFGFICGFILLLKTKRNKLYVNTTVPILIFGISFLLLISLSSKKLGIRYSLPMLPWFTVFSSWGLLKIFRLFTNKLMKFIAGFVMIISLVVPLSYSPDYHLYYNWLVGGPKGAQKYDMVGFCSSTRLAAKYLEREQVKGKIYVAGCEDPVRYYSGLNLTKNYDEADYIILETYLTKQHPESEVIQDLQKKVAWQEINFKGAVIAKIFQK